jgi:hypothetical protein
MEAAACEHKEELRASAAKRAVVDLTEQSDGEIPTPTQENPWKPFYLTSVAGLPAEHNGEHSDEIPLHVLVAPCCC